MDRAGELLAEDVHHRATAQLGEHDEEEHGERRDLDAAGRAGRSAADEHQDVHPHPGLVVHLPDVDAS